MSENVTPKPVDLSQPTPATNKAMVTQSYLFSGPVPHPTLLNKYDEKAREIILTMADRQSRHRQQIERTVITAQVSQDKLGMMIAAGLTVLLFLGGMFLLMNDKDAVGFLMIFGPVLFHAGNYLYLRSTESSAQSDLPASVPEAPSTVKKKTAKN
jgi:uncharacterized membrane protein